MKTLLSTVIAAVLLSTIAIAAPTIVTQDNFPQAFTNMRLGAMVQKAGGINKFFAMPVPSSIPEEQFVVRMNRDTPYSVSVTEEGGRWYKNKWTRKEFYGKYIPCQD